jgi:hypothetical protein
MIDEKCIIVLKATNLTNMSPVKRNGKIDFVTRLKNGEVNVRTIGGGGIGI